MKLNDITRGLKARGGKALVAFFTAGYPDEDTFVELVLTACQAGCDAIEIGVPFSDPIADGPVIQESSEAALKDGMTVSRALELAGEISSRVETPLVAMSYINPILNMGLERFAHTAAGAGISGLILPDVSLEESADIRQTVQACGVDYIDLIAPTSDAGRVERITHAADGAGFLYLVAVTGVTGAREAPSGDLEGFVDRVRDAAGRGTDGIPLYVGFGVSSAEQAQRLVSFADGVIVGSQLIRIIHSENSTAGAVERVNAFLGSVKRAIDRVP